MGEDQRRTLLAFLLIIGILIIWSFLYKPKTPQLPKRQEWVDTAKTIVKLTEPDIISKDTIVIDKDNIKVILSTAGGSVKSFTLKKYNIDIVPEGKYLFISSFGDKDSIVNFDFIYLKDSVVFSQILKNNKIRKVYHFDNEFGFRVVSYSPDTAPQILGLKSGVRITEKKNPTEDLKHFNVYIKDEKINNITKNIKDNLIYPGNLDWFGLRNKYFLLAIDNLGHIDSINLIKLSASNEISKEKTTKTMNGEFHMATFGCTYFQTPMNRYGIEIITNKNLDILVLLLPIKYSELARFKKGYETIVSSGVWGPIARIILSIFNFFFSIFGNYGIAVIIFAILLKVSFFPLSRQTIISQHRMQMVQPELKKIQQKYKDDPQMLNREMMHLYKTYKVNPFTGCLPLLIQLPIFMALYQTLSTSIEFRQAKFALWITDLSLKDPYYVLPIGMGVLMLVQSLMSPIDPRQRFMVILMPIFMIYVFLNFPSGLQLYWFIFNILTLIEYYITKRGGIK